MYFLIKNILMMAKNFHYYINDFLCQIEILQLKMLKTTGFFLISSFFLPIL